MYVLLDLDGTLVNTNSEKFNDLKYGKNRHFAVAEIPEISGADEFVKGIQRRGHYVTIVSDSHGAYVGPLAEKRFGVPWFALADKPNTAKLRTYLEGTFDFPSQALPEEFLLVGDSKLDVQLARGLSIPSVMVGLSVGDQSYNPHYDKSADEAQHYREGATYNCRSFDDVLAVLDDPARRRLVLEDPIGTAAARLYTGKNANNGFTLLRGLGRQQQGPCDAYGAIGRYYKFGSEDRTDEFLQKTARDVSRYLQKEVLSYSDFRWDLVTCVADKATTKPPRKMAKLLHALDVGLAKEEIFGWSPGIIGSIRQEKNRSDRIQFVKRFAFLNNCIDLRGSNVIVVDDQFTTGATAMSHVDMLLDAGVCNVLFIALFYLTNEVSVETHCPRCGKLARIKYRKKDGGRFYSCVSPKYNGDGCGWIRNIDSGNF